MGQEDWYRSTEWNDAIETKFRSRLSKCRSQRPQYLKIQASFLVRKYPQKALALNEEYFDTKDSFFVSDALSTQARAHCALDKISEAISSYKLALDWEQDNRGIITNARLDLPKLVTTNGIESEYDYALKVLTERFTASDHAFPITRYTWNGSCAIIASARGEAVEAREFAERALRAAAETESPFRYHRRIGIVGDATDQFARKIKSIARPSMVRSLFRLATAVKTTRNTEEGA